MFGHHSPTTSSAAAQSTTDRKQAHLQHLEKHSASPRSSFGKQQAGSSDSPKTTWQPALPAGEQDLGEPVLEPFGDEDLNPSKPPFSKVLRNSFTKLKTAVAKVTVEEDTATPDSDNTPSRKSSFRTSFKRAKQSMLESVTMDHDLLIFSSHSEQPTVPKPVSYCRPQSSTRNC